MFHALDQLVKGLLASGKKSWRVDPLRPVSFIASDGGRLGEQASAARRSPPSQNWGPIVERCHGMATLAGTSQFSELLSVFGSVLWSTKKMVRTAAPDFLVYFWKICIAFFQVRIGGRRDYLCLRLFLYNLRAYPARSLSVGAHHAVTAFTTSFIVVIESEPLDLKVTLGLASLLGGDHAIVLSMTTHCVRHWPVVRRADELWRITRDISMGKATTGRLQATIMTRAFDFTTEISTAHHLEGASNVRDAGSAEASQAMAFGCLETAIEILRKGSIECQIRAVAFAKRLEVYLRASGRKKQGLEEKDRGRDVRLAIKRAVMEPSWVPRFVPTMRKSSRRRAPTTAAWAAQKRRTRIESREHLTCMLQTETRTRISA
ncbi:hypothetical protein CSAL01_01974 [Colletotrichum salicis]|uniref:Uncharacterized protein n=1 Tax=Colletotrichum salicis TaxID=1209931 RepID=A0A135TCC0_9PEZI|nr:hypothetical protein CSAL01_01974 [Colletotrichum salicis]